MTKTSCNRVIYLLRACPTYVSVCECVCEGLRVCVCVLLVWPHALDTWNGPSACSACPAAANFAPSQVASTLTLRESVCVFVCVLGKSRVTTTVRIANVQQQGCPAKGRSRLNKWASSAFEHINIAIVSPSWRSCVAQMTLPLTYSSGLLPSPRKCHSQTCQTSPKSEDCLGNMSNKCQVQTLQLH